MLKYVLKQLEYQNMFANILFLILVLLLINTVPDFPHSRIESPLLAFSLSVGIYLLLCLAIFFQGYVFKNLLRRRSSGLNIVINLELILYLLAYQYILDAGRIFRMLPYMQNFQILNAGWELLLYFGGLIVFYSATFPRYYQAETRLTFAMRQIRLLIPFVIPFLFITLALDLMNLLLESHQASASLIEWVSLCFSLILMAFLLIFLPFFIQAIWKCRSLPEGHLKERLNKICEKAGFTHAGMKTWSIMHDQLTAGIVGVVPSFRYVMFTDRLLRELPTESIEAILAHEIGHNARRHLWIYPFILMGMVVAASLFFYGIGSPLTAFLLKQNLLYSSLRDFIYPAILFFLYAAIVTLYFRYVFGFFSRLFERQADLHVFELGLPPEDMIQALRAVAVSSGGYETPNWHHFSIKERVEFLEECKIHPSLIQKHHRKVKFFVWFYFIGLFFSGFYLMYMAQSSPT